MLRDFFFWLLVFGGVFLGLLFSTRMMNSTIEDALNLQRAQKRTEPSNDLSPVVGPGYLALLGRILPKRRTPRAAAIESMDTTTYASTGEDDHVALLDTSRETEDLASLLPGDLKRGLAQLMADMDFNSDGFIDRRELQVWMKSALRTELEREAVDRFVDVDRDANRMITWKELYTATYGPENEERLRADPKKEVERKLMDDDKEKFEAADSNKDGKLNLREFVQFIAPEEFPQMYNLLLKNVLRSKDVNKDGRIDFDEFAAGYPKDDSQLLLAERKRFDKVYDENGDGYLIGTEILTWLFPSNDVLAERQVTRILDMVDEDHDGRLSYREFSDKFDRQGRN